MVSSMNASSIIRKRNNEKSLDLSQNYYQAMDQKLHSETFNNNYTEVDHILPHFSDEYRLNQLINEKDENIIFSRLNKMINFVLKDVKEMKLCYKNLVNIGLIDKAKINCPKTNRVSDFVKKLIKKHCITKKNAFENLRTVINDKTFYKHFEKRFTEDYSLSNLITDNGRRKSLKSLYLPKKPIKGVDTYSNRFENINYCTDSYNKKNFEGNSTFQSLNFPMKSGKKIDYNIKNDSQQQFFSRTMILKKKYLNKRNKRKIEQETLNKGNENEEEKYLNRTLQISQKNTN